MDLRMKKNSEWENSEKNISHVYIVRKFKTVKYNLFIVFLFTKGVVYI